MSLVKRLADETRRVKTGKAKKSRGFGLTVDVDVARIDNLLQAFPIELRRKVLRQAVRAAGRVVANEARRNLQRHRSSRTGTAEIQSEKVKQQIANREGDLYKSIGVKLAKERANATTVAAFVGPRRSHGNHGNLLEYGATIQLWGTDKTYKLPPRPFMRPAFDSTRREQSNAAANKVKTEWRKI